MGLQPRVPPSLGKKVEPQQLRSLTGRQAYCRLTSATTPGQELGRYSSEEVEEPSPSLSVGHRHVYEVEEPRPSLGKGRGNFNVRLLQHPPLPSNVTGPAWY